MAILEITLDVDPAKRQDAAAIYSKYREPFLTTIEGATSKQLLIRDNDVQVLHGFDSVASASAYLESSLFSDDVVGELAPLLNGQPDIRVYDEA